jgi:hypothetical protein
LAERDGRHRALCAIRAPGRSLLRGFGAENHGAGALLQIDNAVFGLDPDLAFENQYAKSSVYRTAPEGSRRFDYTEHGDAINTAARLESANKALGTRICIARATAEKVGAIAFLPIDTLMLKGKTQGVEVFAPEPAEAGAWRADYLDAFARMSKGDETGSAALVALAERHPDHPVLALHARRIRAGQRSARMAA